MSLELKSSDESNNSPLNNNNNENSYQPQYPIGAPRESLLQFKEPELYNPNESNNQSNKQQLNSLKSTNNKLFNSSSNHTLSPINTNGKSSINSTNNNNTKISQLSEILNSILPPRLYLDPNTGSLLKQSVSSIPSSRESVIELQRKLDEILQERQARENGICPVREELFSQCFDELIREVTIESPERGLLLLRIRDEIRMTISAYQTLYQSSITFGMRKSLQAESGLIELQSQLELLESQKLESQQKVLDHRILYESIEKRIIENRINEEKKMNDEIEFLKFQSQHLESFLKSASSN